MAIQVSGTTVIDNSRNIINVATGSSTAPSISPTSDSNTGIYFPVADNLSFATGGELRVNIGSTGIVSFTGSITEFYQGQYWNVVTQADVGYGASQVPLNQYLGKLAFLDDFSPNGLRRDGGGSDDVVVNSLGFVGIGNTNPTEKLDVTGTVKATLFSGSGASLTNIAYANTAGVSTNLKGGSGGSIPYQSAADTTSLLSNGSAGQILQSNGGTNAPSWVNAAPASAITGLTIRDEGFIIGSANSISQLNFVGSNISATSSGNISTVTVSDNLVGTGLSISGITTFTNGPVYVGSAITFYPSTGIVSAYAFYGNGQNLTDIVNDLNIVKIEGIEVQEEGVGIGTTFKTFNFVGPNVTASGVGNTATITIGDYVNFSGISTSVIGGIGSIAQLQVSGISTFNNGPVFIGSETSTGTISQRLQVTGGAYVSGNLGVGSTNPTSKLHVIGDILVNDTTIQGSVTKLLSTTTSTSIHSLLASTYRSVEYTIQATQGTKYQSTKILALHDGITAYHSEYGTIFNNSIVSTFDVDISGGYINLMASGSLASSTEYVVYFVATKI